MGRRKFYKPFLWLTSAGGGAGCVLSFEGFSAARLDAPFILLAGITVLISSRISIQIPRINTNLTVSDTFIFLTMLLYGGAAAVLVAAAEGLAAGLRVSKTPRTIAFNGGAAAGATYVNAQVMSLAFGPTTELFTQSHSSAATALCVMALVQYFVHTAIVATGIALKDSQPIFQTWIKHCHWVSISYLIGALAAGLIAGLVGSSGLFAILVAMPVVFVIYLTYSRYLDDVKNSARQAELAERARAELAERHVDEQARYIAELERVRKELEESREHFRHAAFHDALTGLPNRLLLLDHLRLSIERAKRRGHYLFAVLFLDLDRFKNINDSLGHAAGDLMLEGVARRLETCLRPTDTVARLSGDEFAILLDGLDHEEDAARVAERVQEETVRPFRLHGQEVYTTASIGIALCDSHYDNPENILRDADTAMYKAKENGKARYEVFDAAMHANVVARLQMESDLRRAIDNREFVLHYQPIVALSSGRIVGFEALARWRHPARGFISPAEFIPLAEETGLIGEIGSWVLLESCRQMRAWHALHLTPRPLTISVNISGKQFAQRDLLLEIKRVLRETELDPSFLKLEITESAVMENAEAAASLLTQLRDIGIQLSIDDFGTGYSSLSYLHRFPVDTLKVDRSFVTRMNEGDENAEIVKTIITLATNLGMAVIAEGVETPEQRARLTELKCTYGQGYFFSRPLDASAALDFVISNRNPTNCHQPDQNGIAMTHAGLSQ